HHRELAVLFREAARAVDGVDDPQPRPRVRDAFQRWRRFLGTQRVGREGLVQVLQDDFLRFTVGNGTDVRPRIGDALEVFVVSQDQRPGEAGSLDSDLQLSFIRHINRPQWAADGTQPVQSRKRRPSVLYTTSAISLNSM